MNYDTKEGILKYMADGLPGLHRLAKHRREAYHESKQKLQWWVIYNTWVTDECGNLTIITDEPRRRVLADDVMNHEETFRNRPTISTAFERIAPLDDVCPRCEKGWNIETGKSDV